MGTFKRENLEFHYLERGSGIPVFFQHGLGGETEKVFELIELPAGFRLLGLDCRAHGKISSIGNPERLCFDAFSEDLLALMDHLHIGEAVLGGTSMGAGVALNLTLRWPQRVRGLILLRPAWLDSPNLTNAELFSLIAKILRANGPGPGRELFRNTEAYSAVARHSSDAAASLLALFSDARAMETLARLERIPMDAPNRNRAEWRNISVPTLIMATPSDPIHPFEYAQELAREIPGARFEPLVPKSVGLIQYKTGLNRCLTEFLQVKFGNHSFRRQPPVDG